MAVKTPQLREFRFGNGLVILLALAMQVLLTISVKGTQIRVSAADFFLPLMLAVVFLKLRTLGTELVEWRVKRVWGWIFVLTIWFSVALVQGYYFTGGIQSWAFVNKYLGWYVLLIFFIFGALSANHISHNAFAAFCSVLLISSCALSLSDIVPYVQTMRGLDNYYRLEGLAGNPNAYGFLLVIVSLVIWARQSTAPVISKSVDILANGLLLALIVFSGSRSAWLGLLCGVGCLALAGRIRYIHMMGATVVAVCLVVTINSAQPIELAIRTFAGGTPSPNATASVVPYIQRSAMLEDSGVNHRIEILHNALSLWRQQPILGTGLGSFLWSELKAGRTSTIHTTALWLLAETGLIGLLLFSGFLADMMFQLWKQRNEDEFNGMVIGGLAVLSAFAGASIGLEAMYQRHVWFLAGMALARWIAPRPPTQ